MAVQQFLLRCIQSRLRRMSDLGTCRGRTPVVKACDLQCRHPPQGSRFHGHVSLERRGLRPRRGPVSSNASLRMIYSRETACAVGSEYGWDAGALTVKTHCSPPFFLGWCSPGCGLLRAAEPDECWTCRAQPSTPGPLPAMPAASHRIERCVGVGGSCL